ncbi:MAG: HPr family phosphocarrier protein [Actinomycetaceae bacterium]|nr:HPr family phosphocarrier protein [Actinomycetaceae bacterium]
MSVGFVLVSHSAKAAQAVAELAAQMAPTVVLVPTGGDAGGGYGSDFTAVLAACEEVEQRCEHVVLMADLGSARMSAEMAVEAGATVADGRPRRILGAGPFLEGIVAGSAAAQAGAGVDEVLNAVASPLAQWTSEVMPGGTSNASCNDASTDERHMRSAQEGTESATGATSDPGAVPASGQQYSRQVVIADSAGLHARPAALLAQLVAKQPVRILVNGAEADSMMTLMLLGVSFGDTVTVSSPDADARQAVDTVADAIAAGLEKLA